MAELLCARGPCACHRGATGPCGRLWRAQWAHGVGLLSPQLATCNWPWTACQMQARIFSCICSSASAPQQTRLANLQQCALEAGCEGIAESCHVKVLNASCLPQVHDNSIPFMPRVEVLDARSGGHLGACWVSDYMHGSLGHHISRLLLRCLLSLHGIVDERQRSLFSSQRRLHS